MSFPQPLSFRQQVLLRVGCTVINHSGQPQGAFHMHKSTRVFLANGTADQLSTDQS